MYLVDTDVPLLLDRLQHDAQIAFIVPCGGRRFRAQRLAAPLQENRYLLWHASTGPLPESAGLKEPDRWIVDPFAGWESNAVGEDGWPHIGGYQTTVMELAICQSTDMSNVWHAELGAGNVLIPRKPDPNGFGPPIGLSHLRWTGNYWNGLGGGALKMTERWWQRFRSWTKKSATRIPRFGSLERKMAPSDGVYAFPRALSEIRRGRFRGVNP